MQSVHRMPCAKLSCRGHASRSGRGGPMRLCKSGRAVNSRRTGTSPPLGSSSKADSRPFVHPELEGPLEYLPSGWSNRTAPSMPHSLSFYPSLSCREQQNGKGQWVGQWTRQEPSRSSMWDRQSSSGMWDPSSRGSLAPHDQKILQTSLRNHLFRALSDQPAINLLEAGPHTLQRLTRVFGLVFRQPGNDQEGFYSLHAHTGGSDCLACEIIMVFELQEEAERYACLLEAAMEPHHPRVFSISAALLVRFCREHGYQCRMEPAGSLTVPPHCSLTLTDWERVKNLRNGSFLTLDEEPNPASSDQSSGKTSSW